MKLTKTLLLSVAAAFGLTSCLSSDPGEQTITYTYTNSLSFVQDIDNGTYKTFDGATYEIDFDLTAGTAEIDITKLYVAEASEMSPMNIKIDKTNFTINSEGAIVVSLPTYTSVYGGETHTLTNFRLSQLNRIINQAGVSSTIYTVEFVVDDRYRVKAIQKSTILLGDTNVLEEGENKQYTGSTAPYYFYSLDFSKKTATFQIYNLPYNGVTQSIMVLEGIPYTVDVTGVRFEAEGPIEPSKMSNASENPVTKFKALLTTTPTMTLSFTVADKYMVSASLDSGIKQSSSSTGSGN